MGVLRRINATLAPVGKQTERRYRTVPGRYLAFPGFRFSQADWDDLQVPVELAFLFEDSVQHRVVVCSPSPAGAAEFELPMAAWARLLEANPGLDTVHPDVEALLVRGGRPGEDASFTCHVIPVDACYELVGRMRATWRGVDGGQEARAALEDFLAMVEARSRPRQGPRRTLLTRPEGHAGGTDEERGSHWSRSGTFGDPTS